MLSINSEDETESDPESEPEEAELNPLSKEQVRALLLYLRVIDVTIALLRNYDSCARPHRPPQAWSAFDFESEFCGKKNQLDRVMRKQPAIVVAHYGHKVESTDALNTAWMDYCNFDFE